MDQLKVFLGYLVQYRFWVAIGIATLLSPIAYFATAGAMIEQEKSKTSEIKSAYEEVQKFQSGQVQNKQWADEVTQRTEAVNKDVNASWRMLYEKQAPLLTWPSRVQPIFLKWGRKHPEGVDPQRIRDVALDYINDYPAYVDEVYKSFSPFNSEDGTGIVAAAPKDFLLEPAEFHEESPPTLTEIWRAQEKLWIQRTLLDVIAQVNKKANAKDWDSAYVKEIRVLQVANPYALDQKTASKEEEVLEDAPEILAPGAAAPDAEATATGGARESTATVQYVKTDNKDQYFVVPVMLKVLVEQNHINEFLVEFNNSPMSIQVLDFEFVRPLKPVRKPKKGEALAIGGGGMGGMRGGRGGRGGMDGMAMGGDLMGGEEAGDMEGEGYSGGSGSSYNNRMGSRSRPGRGMGDVGKAGAPAARQGGQSVLNQNLQALKDAKTKAGEKKDEEKEPEITVSNPYFNVVEVTIKGQARFYQTPPPVEESTEPVSPGAPAEEAKTEGPAAPTEPAKTEGEPAKTEPAKPEAPAAPPTEPAKPEAPSAPPTEPAKPEAPKAENPPAPAPPTPPGTPATPADGKPDAPKGR